MRAGRPWKRMRSRAMSSQRCRWRVVRQQLLHLGVGAVDVLRVARQRRPAERADAAAEQRADVGRHEAGEVEGVGDALLLRHLADVVAVVDRRHAHAGGSRASRATCSAMERLRGGRDRLRVALAPRLPFAERPALRQVAVDRVVRRGLVGHAVGPHAAAHQFREHVGGVAEQADRDRRASRRRPARSSPAPRRGVGLPVEIAGPQPHLDAARLAFDRQAARRPPWWRPAAARRPCRRARR